MAMAMPMSLLVVVVVLVYLQLPLGVSSGRPTVHHSHKHHSPPPPPPQPQPQATALVRTTCNTTTYYDVCVAALAADPSSSTADVRGLSAIAVSAAAANASSAASVLANATTAVLRACAARYADARDALHAARDSIGEEDYDYASVHVSAAAEYPAVCRALFRRQRPAGDYPPELARQEEGLERLCTVALDIISLLA